MQMLENSVNDPRIPKLIEEGLLRPTGSARLTEPEPFESHKYLKAGHRWFSKKAVEQAMIEAPDIADLINQNRMMEADAAIEATGTCGTPVVMEAQEGVGDVTSDAKGSGARFNAGKAPLELIPIEQLIPMFEDCDPDGRHEYIITMLEHLSGWQKGDDECLVEIISNIEWDEIEEAAHVWAYGARKYAAWNWAKGMAWSIPVACILRHCKAIIVDREEIDPESGREHWGHVVCNLLMLDHFRTYYRKGDDRPPRVIFEV